MARNSGLRSPPPRHARGQGHGTRASDHKDVPGEGLARADRQAEAAEQPRGRWAGCAETVSLPVDARAAKASAADATMDRIVVGCPALCFAEAEVPPWRDRLAAALVQLETHPAVMTDCRWAQPALAHRGRVGGLARGFGADSGAEARALGSLTGGASICLAALPRAGARAARSLGQAAPGGNKIGACSCAHVPQAAKPRVHCHCSGRAAQALLRASQPEADAASVFRGRVHTQQFQSRHALRVQASQSAAWIKRGEHALGNARLRHSQTERCPRAAWRSRGSTQSSLGRSSSNAVPLVASVPQSLEMGRSR